MAGIFRTRIVFLGMIALLSIRQGHTLSITSIQAGPSSGPPMIMVQMDQPVPLTIDQEDPSTLLIELPSGTQWKTALTGTFNNGFQNYSYTPYKNGAGDLIVKIDPRFKVGKSGTAPNGIFGISLLPPATSKAPPATSGPLIISNVQIGPKLNNTRVVFHLNRSGAFRITEDPSGQKIMVFPSEPTEWKPPPSFVKENGVFKSYQLVAIGKDVGVELRTSPGTHLLNASIMNPQSSSPKLVIDIGNQPFVPRTSGQSALASTAPSSAMDVLKRNSQPLRLMPPSLIKKMAITNQGDETIVRFSMEKPIEFHVTENPVTKEITVEIPKVDWSKTDIPKTNGGLIDRFEVNQTSETLTKLIFHVRPETKIVEKKLLPNGADSRFILILSQGSDKTPTWLVDGSDAYLTLSKTSKAGAETSIISHRGGIAPFMNIGDGIYIGAGLSQVGTENNSHSNFSGNSFDMPQSDFGGNGRVFAGYGAALDRYYASLELGAAFNGAEDKTQFQTGTMDLKETFQMKSTWDASLRLGYYISPSTLFYGKGGCASTQFALSAKNYGTEVGSYSKQGTSGFIFGMGLESALNDHLTVRLEGSQTTYQPIRLMGSTYNRKDRMIATQVFGGVAYKLNPMMGPSAQDFYDESVSSGFYFGANTGFKNLTDIRKVDGTLNGTTTTYESQDSTIEPAWGVYGGYSMVQDRVYYAGELDFDLNPMVIEGRTSTTTRSESYTNKMSWLTALVGRMGYVFNFGTIGYGTFGLAMARVAHTATVSDGNRVTTSGTPEKANAFGIRAGAGIEAFLTRHISLRGDYTFDYFPTIVFKDKVTGTHDKNTFLNSEFKVGLTYILNP